MKLATYKDGSRDGQLVVVSRDLAAAHYATGIADRLQQVLDDWNFLAPQLQDLYDALNQGRSRHAFAFDPARCMAPLPRAYQWVRGSAYLQTDSLIDQGASDHFLGPRDPIVLPREELGVDFEAGLAVVTGDVQRAASPEQALDGVRLLMLVNDVSLRSLVAPEREAKDSAGVQGRPATAFSPVALTPDELGEAWQGGRVHLSLHSSWNGRKVGLCETGPDMRLHFGELIAQVARLRPVRAGSIVGSGVVSNPAVEAASGRMEWPRGFSCIADKRAAEIVLDGQPSSGYLKFGDTVRIEMKGKDGQSLFGAIDQELASGEA
ncbi:fumarylacetoacetate hydrolase family protein [Ramlibacter rhizophilus]|uniref:Fumarylacetoacetate hydrolase n=1 Tax=Ramlibacter rhizophilus TaxID=1781167 RepID=A0A4Z0BEV5_9BURK|nr:fumarylacetoacetate hydrolase family protein [Ramlibacter rhizophilus]TFY97842.1 fumarylacetoacetate hydrolase [Ramlibacter rhizophilus]